MPASERELEFLDIFCDKDKISVDVGANEGEYTRALMPLSSRVYAYEPIPRLAEKLRADFSKDVVVRECALSDAEAEVVLYIPEYTDTERKHEVLEGWASIVKDYSDVKEKYPERFPKVQELSVSTKTLDSENLSPVGFVKIDAEGGELAVLKGGRRLLRDQHPVLLIEIEERHRKDAIATVGDYLTKLGYRGYFIFENSLRPLKDFSIPTMQSGKIFPGKIQGYINNFMFIPAGKEHLVDLLRQRLSHDV